MSDAAATDAVAVLLSLPDETTQTAWLLDYCAAQSPARLCAFAEALKAKTDTWHAATALGQARHGIHLLYTLATLTQNPLHRAIALRADGNARLIGMGEFQVALNLYDEAAAIYQAAGLPADAAGAQVGKVWALAMLERYDEIRRLETHLPPVLEDAGRWHILANFYLNLGAVYGRIARDAEALALLDKAKTIYLTFKNRVPPAHLAMVDNSRAIHLRHLGAFADSITASQAACEHLHALGLTAEAANAEQTLAVTYLYLGRYNEALRLFEAARMVFWAEARWHQTLMVDLSIGDCLLYLRRFRAVLERVQQIRHLLRTRGGTDPSVRTMEIEAGQALLLEAAAYRGLNDSAGGLDSLSEARRLFEARHSPVWVATCDYERAQLHLSRHELAESIALARAAAAVFEAHRLPTRAVQAWLVLARSQLLSGDVPGATTTLSTISTLATPLDLPFLTYQAALLRGDVALTTGSTSLATEAYECALEAIEQLRGWLMIEMRTDFVADKQTAYETLVTLYSTQGEAARALTVVERAKSRALLDLLAYRLDLTLTPRRPEDRLLVEELSTLRHEWDRLFRIWEHRTPADAPVSRSGDSVEVALRQHERRMTELWQSLLVRDATYVRDAALWQVQTETPLSIQAQLAPDTALIEYFTTPQRCYAFVVTAARLICLPLAVAPRHIHQLHRQLALNLAVVPRSTPETVERLGKSLTIGPLRELYRLLVAPLEPHLAECACLRIVPHGELHYLPFHALYDGSGYLIDRYAVSYLPSASVLPYLHQPSTATERLVFGYSNNGHLPGRVQEAQTVARLVGGHHFLESQATVARVREQASGTALLHLATHGYFHQDNPRFSGVVLADGYLTTMDIFGLQLPGTFVTLSACQTHHSHLGGGDELLGLAQAFLHAGATGLLLSQWAVSDTATLELMTRFYEQVALGVAYPRALQSAQQTMAHDPHWSHPFFWAAFFLSGTSR